MDIRNYLHGKGLSWKESRRSSGKIEAILDCPFCDDTKKKFAVNLDNGTYNCFRQNTCGVHGNFYQLQLKFGDKPMRKDTDRYFTTKKNKQYSKPEVKARSINECAWKFFQSRKIKESTLKEFKIANKNDNTIMFPFFKGGNLVDVKYRSLTEKKFWKEKNTECVLFNSDMCDNSDTLYICEGEIDSMSLYQYGIKSTSLPQGVNNLDWIENQWEWLDQFQKIFLIMDNDSAGQSSVTGIVKRLGEWRCYNVVLPMKDANECLMNDIPQEKIYECMVNAEEFNFDNIINAEDIRDEVVELFMDKNKTCGTAICFDGLDNILRGWRPGEVTVWSGKNGSGKTTIINQILTGVSELGERCCLASLELRAARLLRWAILQKCEKFQLQENEINSTIDWYSDKWWFYNSTREVLGDELLDAFRFAARKHGIKNFLIDSLMKVKFKKSDQYTAQKEFVSDLTNFAKEFDCHVHLVAHPRKSEKDMDSPDKVDVAGTGHITDLADNVIVAWRPNEEFKEKMRRKGNQVFDCILSVKKNREWGTESSVRFNFREDCKKFFEEK